MPSTWRRRVDAADWDAVAADMNNIGGALLPPGSLAIIQASFAPDDRPRAIGAWSGLGGVAGAIGPFLGGALVDILGRAETAALQRLGADEFGAGELEA